MEKLMNEENEWDHRISADAVGETRIWWNKFRQLVQLIDISLIATGRLYSSCVWSSMLHWSETWPIRKKNEVALQRAEMRIIRWMCGIKLRDRVWGKGLREKLGLNDIISVLQQNRLRWFGHVLRRKDNDWWRNVWSMKCRVSGQEVDQRKLGQIVEKDCQACKWTEKMPWIVIDGGSR